MGTTIVTQLLTATKAQVSAALGSAFIELPFGIDPQLNSKIMSNNRYSVVPGDATETTGVNRFYTMDHNFIINLTNGYVQMKGTDAGKQTASNDLMNKAHDVYTKLFQTRCGLPSSVMNVKNLSIAAPVYFEEEDAVLITFTLTITYRQAI